MWYIFKYTLYPVLLIALSILMLVIMTLQKVAILIMLVFSLSLATSVCIIIGVIQYIYSYVIMFRHPEERDMAWLMYVDWISNKREEFLQTNELAWIIYPFYNVRIFQDTKPFKDVTVGILDHYKTFCSDEEKE